VAEATAGGVVVRRLPFDRAIDAAAPEATLPASAPQRLSAAIANGTAAVAWSEGDGTRVAWAPAGGAWRVASAPCGTASNLAVRAGEALVACVSPDAIPERDIPAGHVAIYALNLTAGNLTLRGHAPVVGEPRLMVNETDALLLAAFSYEGPRKVHLRLASSPNGTAWFLPIDAGGHVHRPDAPPATSVRVLAMAYQPSTQTIHLIWAETPETLNATDRRVVKSLVAITPRGVLAYKHDLDVDEPAARVQGGALAAPVEDASDALLVFGARELIAFGDDGALVHGELLEHAAPGFVQRPVPQPPQKVSSTVTGLTNAPPPRFTLGFEIAAGILLAGAAARVLVGRIVTRTSADPHDKKEGP
jgi:hypothetical protein